MILTVSKQDYVFMNIALEFSKMSHCISHKVAAIAVKDGRIVSTGINGTAPGYFNCDDIFDKSSFDRDMHHQFSETYEIHAEMNCILYAARKGIALENSVLYCTLAPCWNCLKNLSVMKINKIFYCNDYDMLSNSKKGINDYCNRLGIELCYINMKENPYGKE